MERGVQIKTISFLVSNFQLNKILENQKSILNLGFITPIEGQSRTTNEYQNIKTESCDDSFQLSLNREHYIEPIIEIEDDNSSLENNVKQDVVDEPKEIPSSNTLDIDTKVNNYKEKFFDYKNFPVLNDNLKRKRETFDNQVREVNKRSKKEDWIQKEKMKNDDYNKETIDENVNKSPDSVDSGFGSNFNTNTVPIDTKSDKKEKKTDFSQISVEFESKQPSKDKQYNFKVEQKASVVYKDNKVPKGRHSLLENLNQTEEESGNPIRPNSTGNKNYELDLLSLEATYDDFYELKYKKDLPKKLNNSTNNHKTIYNPNIRKMNMTNIINNTMNTRNKKEREKMKAHKCEICTKVI